MLYHEGCYSSTTYKDLDLLLFKLNSNLSDLRLVPFSIAKLVPQFVTIVGTSHSLSDEESEAELYPASFRFIARLTSLRACFLRA